MYLSCHDSLSLLDEVALGALAVPVLAASLVTLEPGDDPVVSASGTLGPPEIVLSRVHLISLSRP